MRLTKKIYYLVYCLLVVGLAFFNYPLYYFGVFFSGGLLIGFQHLAPPFVIYLSVSNDDSINYFQSIFSAIFPLRVVSLFDSKSSEVRINKFVLLMEGIRINKGKDWIEPVKKLTSFAPVIIVDTRTITSSVQEEIDMILSSERKDKAIFIYNSPTMRDYLIKNGVSPSLVINNDILVLNRIHGLRKSLNFSKALRLKKLKI